MKLSVVVISYNQSAFIQRLVIQLLDQDFAHDDYEVIVVECASDDGTAEWLRGTRDGRLKPVYLTGKCNRSAGRNCGIEASSGTIVVMVDGDHTVSRDFLSAHAMAHQSEICAIVGKSVFAHNPKYAAINAYLDGSGASKLPYRAKLPGRYFLTRNCSVHKSIVDRVGGFDEGFDRWGGEDLDFGVRIEEAGFPIYGEPCALAIHHHHRSIRSVLDNMENYGKGSVPRLIAKHPQLFSELNLDRLYSNPVAPNRFSAVSRLLFRAICSPMFYYPIRTISEVFSSARQPRFILDYLHLRQYSQGYMSALSENRK